MNYLSLFSGVEGGGLAFQYLINPKLTCIGYVEYDQYRQKVLKQRIKDGLLDTAPIFGDIRKFISEGYAEAYQGMVDVITAGFPCQPFSVAGKQKADQDERNMWPATLRVIEIVKPRFAFLENVRGLLSSGYFQVILRGLFEAGYDARWCVLGAGHCGAPILRERLWILGEPKGQRYIPFWDENPRTERKGGDKTFGSTYRESPTMGKKGVTIRPIKWPNPPTPVRMANELAGHLDRLKAIGNGQVPTVVELAWRILIK